MEPTSVAPDPTPIQPPAVEPAQPETPVDAPSIADHSEQFNPKRERETPANTGQFANKPPDVRHRAGSQRATPEDVAEINRLTKELRELEGKVGEKDPDAKAAPRIKTLQRQIRALKALEQPEPAPKPKDEPVPVTRPVVAGEFAEKKPDIADFQNEKDPLDAYMLALSRWDRKRERWEESQQQATEQYQIDEQKIIEAAHAAIADFKTSTPDFDAKVGPLLERHLPAVLLNAILRHDKRAQVMYHLASQGELVDELILLTEGKSLSDASVATVQRRLTASLQAAQPPDRPLAVPPYIPPRPPNPVRTGPIKTVDDPPADTVSIADHAKYYAPKRR